MDILINSSSYKNTEIKILNDTEDEHYKLIVDLLKSNNMNVNKYYDFNPHKLLIQNSVCLINDNNIKYVYSNEMRKIFYNNGPIHSFTTYSPFYPENFYNYWELLNENISVSELTDISNIGFIEDLEHNYGNIYPLGHIESIIKYCETHTRYENINFTRVLLNPLKKYQYDTKFMYLYKHQVYEFTKKEYHSKLPKQIQKFFKKEDSGFDFMIANCTNMHRNLTSLLVCNCGGTIIMYVSNYLKEKNMKLCKFVSSFFEKVTIYKPTVSNKLNPDCYLVCKNLHNIDSQYPDILNVIETESIYDQNINNFRNKISNDYKNAVYDLMDTNDFNKSKNYVDNECYKTLKYIRDEKYISSAKTWCDKYKMKISSRFMNSPLPDNKNEELKYDNYVFKNYKLKTVQLIIDSVYDFSIDRLHELKRKLNVHKRYIDTKEQFVDNNLEKGIIDWNKLTNNIDIYINLRKMITWKYNSEMTTNAWLKFYEILCNENLFDKNKKKLKTFHICEAPGAFISSLNQYILSNTSIEEFDWYAQSLNPNLNRINSSVLKDSYGLIKVYPKRWLFGPNKTGDITDKENIYNYKKDPKLHNIDLMTGDGGLKIPSNMFNEQESYTAHVNYGQVLTMLHVLPESKNCVFKTFIPFAETFTVSLFALLTEYFGEIKIVKPLTSHPSSSEVYVICKNYIGWENIEQSIRDRLFYFLDNFDSTKSLVPLDSIDIDFIKSMIECSDYFVKSQINSINRSLWYYNKYYDNYDLHQDISYKREEKMSEWMDIYKIKRITDDSHLL
jgi:23S rRNA U2552 (ribose-2'-O)-methylase RlmE/FtsJ